jgi:hypothetical protein
MAGFGTQTAVDAGCERKGERPVDSLGHEVEESLDVSGSGIIKFKTAIFDRRQVI